MPAPTRRLWNPRRFDARAFAEAEGHLYGENALGDFSRLFAEQHPDATGAPVIRWAVQGQMRPGAGGAPTVWMHLRAMLDLSLGCQRCLGAVVVPLAVDRWFRFVADEATAEIEDDDSEEDVLALEPKPDLYALIEDELLMALPLVPMHESCPEPLPRQAAEPASVDSDPPDRPHPFEVLAKLRK